MSKRNIWILLLIALCCSSFATAMAQEGLKAAQDLLKKGKWAQAQEAFDTLLESHPDNFEVRLGMAQASFFNGDPGIGGFHAARALKMKPNNIEASAIAGRCFLAQGHQERQNGGDPTGLYEQAAEELAKATKKKNSADLWREYGSCLYWLSKNKEAAVAYESAFKADPKNFDSAYWAGQFYFRTKQIKKAAAMYTASLCSDIPSSQVQRSIDGLWQCYGNDKKWDALIQCVAQWRKAKPKNDTALWWHGNFLTQKGADKEALAVWKQLETRSKLLRPEAIYYQGVANEALGNREKAIELFTKAGSMRYNWQGQRNPGYALHGIAGSLFGNGQFAKAVNIAETKALPILRGALRVSLQSDMGLFYRDYGSSLERSGKKKQARAAFEKSRDHYAAAVKDMVKYKTIGTAWRAQIQNDYGLMFQYHFDDNETALKNFKIALDYDPTNSDACLNYGRIMLRRGKFAEALRVAQKGKSRGDLDALISQIKRAMNK